MVAHTGVIDAAIKACECVDKCLENIIKEVLNKDGTVLITADHGNVEEMINLKTGGVDTEHSTFPVPFIAINKKWQGKNIILPTGILADVAPTILKILNVEVPKTMTGRNLLEYVID
jgi:2,3-bisphosphoglycerate-independent phosphoglycerate mutase